MVFVFVSDRAAPNSKVPGSRPNPRVQIFPPEYRETYALYKDRVSLEFLFVLLCSRARLGGGATGHAKMAGLWPDSKFDDYTQNSSDLQSKFKNESQNNSRA
jgi:hypothetical protein